MKIGFCFLCQNDIHQLDLWLKFFENNYDKSNIYIHSYDSKNITQGFVKKYHIDKNIQTGWGNIYDVVKYIMKLSQQNNDTKFILLSESTIPCKSFDYIYEYLTNDNYGYMSYVIRSDTMCNWDKNTLKMQEDRYKKNCNKIEGFQENIDYSHWFYNETWIIYNQEMINIILDDNKYYPYFKKSFVYDENYPVYLLSLSKKLNLCRNILTTYANWNIKQSGRKKHPKLHDKVDKEFCNMLKKTPNLLFARKFTKTSNISEYL
tara:strand:- start:827 stop:1612 length:786 start_codon:yes stop_codon:yes gene_type:complete